MVAISIDFEPIVSSCFKHQHINNDKKWSSITNVHFVLKIWQKIFSGKHEP